MSLAYLLTIEITDFRCCNAWFFGESVRNAGKDGIVHPASGRDGPSATFQIFQELGFSVTSVW